MKTKLLFTDSKLNLKNTILFLCFIVFVNFNMNAQPYNIVDGGEISTTDNTTVCVGDGIADLINVTVTGASGRVMQWIITDYDENILALPEASPFDFEGANSGICKIWHLSYNGIKPLVDPSGQNKFIKNLSELVGRYDLSNYIEVIRQQKPTGGTIEGGPFEFCVGDGEADNIPDGAITLSGNSGTNSQWVVTDSDGNILGLPPSPYVVDFDGAGAGTCLVWHLTYEDGLEGLEAGNNTADLMGCFTFTNSISVVRLQPESGTLEGGPFEFCVGDGEMDNIPDGAITLSGNSGTNSQWVVTDSDGNILGLPPSPYVVDFDGAGAGTCLVWHLSYEDGLQGLEGGMNTNDLIGCFSLSNSISVVRLQPESGTLEGGPFEFCVGDGEADNIADGAITLSGNSGTNSQWVVTDGDGNILGLPPSPYVVDFDGAGAGTCLVWHLSYEDGLQGLEGGMNTNDLIGCFSLSNSISVVRLQPEGGLLEGGPFAFTVGDNVADNIAEGAITLSGNSGTNSQWVITDDQGKILGLPPSPYVVDFDGAGAGTCLVWNLSYEDGLQGLENDSNTSDFIGCYSFSNSIEVVRTAASSGRFALYPNPTKGLVNIDLSNFGSTDVRVKVYNFLNVQMFNRNFGFRSLSRSTFTSIDISSYIEGIYFVSVTDNISGKSFVKRLIVK